MQQQVKAAWQESRTIALNALGTELSECVTNADG